MRIFSTLQQRFGFTRNEIKVVLFLSASFLVGFGIRWYNSAKQIEPSAASQFDYSESDSIFRERSKNIVQMPGSPAGTLASRSPSKSSRLQLHSININAASKQQLMQLPGVGQAYADRIIAYRTEHGPFHTADDLMKVSGIGPKKMERLRQFLTVK